MLRWQSVNRTSKLSVAGVIASVAIARAQVPADQPVARADQNSQIAHQQLLEKARQGGIDIYFEGDSITRRWGATDYPNLLTHWKQSFVGWNAANFGWGADTTQNILWRLENGELDGVNPKVIVLLAGTNNIGAAPQSADPDDVARGIGAILRTMREKAPGATIILMGITPRTNRDAIIDQVNERIAHYADGARVRYLNINAKLRDPAMFVDGLHLSVAGYQVWADALKPIFTELLGPPASTDHAPPPTGDPSAQRPRQ
jgi:lysophospholipase L1-like esterase